MSKPWNFHVGADLDAFERANQRINETPELEPYRETCLYDWPEGDGHWNWIATAPIEEIIDWAEVVEKK